MWLMFSVSEHSTCTIFMHSAIPYEYSTSTCTSILQFGTNFVLILFDCDYNVRNNREWNISKMVFNSTVVDANRNILLKILCFNVSVCAISNVWIKVWIEKNNPTMMIKSRRGGRQASKVTTSSKDMRTERKMREEEKNSHTKL